MGKAWGTMYELPSLAIPAKHKYNRNNAVMIPTIPPATWTLCLPDISAAERRINVIIRRKNVPKNTHVDLRVHNTRIKMKITHPNKKNPMALFNCSSSPL